MKGVGEVVTLLQEMTLQKQLAIVEVGIQEIHVKRVFLESTNLEKEITRALIALLENITLLHMLLK